MDSLDPQAALCQQLRADFLLGLRFVPLSPQALLEGIARLANPKGPGANSPQTDLAGRTAGPVSADDLAARQRRLGTLDETSVRSCRKCGLCQSRTQTVFGQGHAAARVVFVGEGRVFEEDKQGLAFVGQSGDLLTKMIVAMGLTREKVYICNVVKCRPPGNRTPTPEEIQACNPYLREQLEIIAPEMIVALGAPASQTLLNTGVPVGKLRGRFHDYYLSGQLGVGRAVPVMPTYHPAYLLRSPSEKGKTWQDLQMVMTTLGLKPPHSQ